MPIDWTTVKHFKPADFRCRGLEAGGIFHDCGLNNPDPQLVYDLDAARDFVNQPLIINSACRCAAHNAAVGGVEPSAHGPDPNDGYCKAVDIQCASDSLRFKLVNFFLARGYVRIEVSNLHVHVDRAQDFRPSPYFGVAWFGGNK